MASAVRISDDLINLAKKISKLEHRSVTGQIEHWALIGKISEENPEMPYSLIKEVLMGLKELESGEFSEYQFDQPL
jgi:hypothetical protein